ncbi:MAG: hypothetical protein IJL78_07835 [Lachnospiraceae bacterium]|nr:hypothetical protein [Lachnospiraceae bacterium]
MEKQRKKPEKKNKGGFTTARLIRLLILIMMNLIMVFLFLIARTIYLGQQEAGKAASTVTDSSVADAETRPTETTPTETEREPEKQTISVAEIETEELITSVPIELDPEEAKAAEAKNLSSGRILIGDSRFAYLGMQIALETGDILIAKGGESFTWFRNTAVPQLKNILDMNPNYDVIINMGINDCANNIKGWTDYFTPDYVDLINELYIRYPTTGFYYASIGPIRGIYPSKYGNISKDDLQLYIDIFNYTMRTQCMATYLELGEYLYDSSPTYIDNVHYDGPTDQRIYDYIRDHVRKSVYDPQ